MLFKHAVRALAAAGVLVAAAATPAHAAATVGCDYTFLAWSNGFTAELKITNGGPPVSGWTARWSVTTPTTLGSVWSARMVQPDAAHLVATNLSYNTVIPTGGSVTFGWTASASSTTRPTDITVNGAPC